MLVSIDLTAATVCTARACSKRLNETQWPKTRPSGPRLRHIALRLKRDLRHIGPRRWWFCPRRDDSTSQDRDVSTETTILL